MERVMNTRMSSMTNIIGGRIDGAQGVQDLLRADRTQNLATYATRP
jgi:hypothetical protein